ncbi:SpoIID/LytB domain-containing protein [Roseofilum capinflatum]|uniref:SpoIID/LytB domain-containing protein n=1 Tax=Roseofilum capinflatum BLCC-M114 TaxID=3022440 RepID=A0ABT7B732_9CYAN|nr:SpoIID/LytB domain-containing protein [Roseofilum capinflatum]MDJ1174439.1 SpoIID/LytB domain-containing protein [Roseofilum capinflatum BLCC-M114]
MASVFSIFYIPVKALLKPIKPHWWLTTLLWMVMASLASAAEVELRVAIQEDTDRVKIGSSTAAIVKDSNGQVIGELNPMDGFTAQSDYYGVSLAQWRAGQLWIEPQNDGLVWIGDRWYRGRLLIMPTDEGITAINYVDIEHYLYSVVGGEMIPSWPLEALKAQAVSARSYALYHRERTADKIYDVGNDTFWQVYGGVEDEYVSTQQAVDATQGQILAYDGSIIEAVFHSSSGGHTENVEDIWSEPRPYLRAVPDYDQQAPVYQWTEVFSLADISELIEGVGNVLSIAPQEKTPQGRVRTLKVTGDQGEKMITGAQLRKALSLRSTLFTIQPLTTGDKATGGASFQVQGRGFGHGLGMSQYGAYAMASQGSTYQDILRHYYTDAYLARVRVAE